MMEAVARRKAHWLLNVGSEKSFNGKRPQEDMVTSAVFGTIRLMSSNDRHEAIRVIVGEKCFKEAGFEEAADITIDLWKRYYPPDRKYVEPDVLLTCNDKTLIIEVKWHATLSDQQIEQQIEQQIDAVGKGNVSAIMMLGYEKIPEKINGKIGFQRTWRDVSGEVQIRLRDKKDPAPFRDWLDLMRRFLQQTDMGRIFNGIPLPGNDPGHVNYCFSKPGHTPWLDKPLVDAGAVEYTFISGEVS